MQRPGNLLQVAGQPNGRDGAFAELSDDLVLAIVEGDAEMDGMVATWKIILDPLASCVHILESPGVVLG